jgi:hypothetical protein
VATTFEWVGKTGVQNIDGKEIQHPKMGEHLAEAKAASKTTRFVRGLAAGRLDAPRMDFRRNFDDQNKKQFTNAPKSV